MTQSIRSNCTDREGQNDPTNTRDYLTENNTENTTTENGLFGCCLNFPDNALRVDTALVQQIFSAADINISVKSVLAILASNYSEQEIRQIAFTLSDRKSRAVIKNPAGVLAADPVAVANAILRGEFYPLQAKPVRSKRKTSYSDEYQTF